MMFSTQFNHTLTFKKYSRTTYKIRAVGIHYRPKFFSIQITSSIQKTLPDFSE